MIARREDVALRLFAFPHAGGAGSSFEEWPAELPEDVEVVSYSLPGRGRQREERPYANWQDLVADLVRLVERYDDGAPFVFFGHSFGALVAFEVCRTLIEKDRPKPAALFLSAHRAPHLTADGAPHLLPDDQFVELVREWGLVPEEFLRDKELLSLILPPLRADLALDTSYRCTTGAHTGRRLSVPCVVYGGEDDRTVSHDELSAWREHFGAETDFRVELFPGEHFYTISSRPTLLRSLRAELERVRAAVRSSVMVAGEPYPVPTRSLWDRFQAQVAATPDALALVDPPRRWTYRELAASTEALASELVARGVGRGEVVGILLPRSAEYCMTLLACFGIGAPACLLEKNWPESLLGQFLANAGVRLVVTRQEFVERLPEDLRTPNRVLALDDYQPAAADLGDRTVLCGAEPDDIALISMTSGTSGVPKAVRNTHLGCLYCFDARYQLYPYQETSRDGLNVFFAWECLRPLLKGVPAVVIPDDRIVDPVRLVESIAEFGITRIVITPSLLESVLDHPVVAPLLSQRLAHMEIVFLMGEVVPTRVVEKAAALFPPGLRLVNAYSTWECLDVSFADLLPLPVRAGPSRPVAPVGRILDGSAAVLLNERGEPVPYGGVGELYFSSPGVADGYLNDPAKTAERFVPCPPALAGSHFADQIFYRTGDRARFLPDGELEILGRSGDVVKVRGFKVSLRAVEAVLADQEGVSRVIVRPVLDERSGQPTGLIAYVLGDAGRPSDTVLARMRLKARRDLPEYARPRHIVGLDSLPISGNDSRKLDFSKLPPPPKESADTQTPTLTTMERRIAAAWREVLGVPSVDPEDNFFDIGGDSLSAARLSGLLAERYGIALPVVDVFQFSTLRSMATHCSTRLTGRESAPAVPRRRRRTRTTRLAIIGMAGRFPGANDLDEFWENLKNGTDSLTTFRPEWLRAKGVPQEALTHPQWVSAGQLIADADKFDAEFWGIGRREATLMDPQHRVFIEVAWAALEQAGYARRNNPYRSRTGVFAACGIDGYLIHHLRGGGLNDPMDPAGWFLTEIGNEKDYIATRVAYLLDLGGPAVTVTSACSSALVAVAQAAQAIVSGQCDMAIAGASAINFPNLGYRYEEGLVGSVDGRVRPFDAAASGTLFGDSVGAIVLKRLDDAVADGDYIWALLTGFGVSNDGRLKAGYTAPSARAQAQAISDAIEMAGIDSQQLSYIECHATATHVGDAIEIAGLHEALRQHRRGQVRPGSCAIGSVKGNIGHANCAAGITGLIKTVLCLHHRKLVPTANYQTLNPKLVDLVDTEDSPLTVQQTYSDWTVVDPQAQLPRRAGVSSFGIGGTNAHVILEEAPEPQATSTGGGSTRSVHLVTVSGASEEALHRNAQAMASFLEGLPAEDVGLACRAMHLSREAHAFRASAVVTGESTAALDDLRRIADGPRRGTTRRGHAATVAFCFPGQGSQTPGMARDLYRGRADGGRFRRHFDAACASMAPHLAIDPAAQILTADETSVLRPTVTQCGLFAVEYALAQTLIEIGVTPVAVAGHSIGEYAAAAVSGLLSLDEAAALVAVRARATEDLIAGGVGGMLSVVGDEDRLASWLDGRDDVWLAVENAPGRVVLSGTTAALRAAQDELPGLGFTCRPVPVTHPFHSPLMLPVARRLDAAAADLGVRTPTVPLASNLTGTWLDPHHEPGSYWGRHLCSTVRWRQCVETLLRWEPDIVLEVGPDTVLTGLTMKCTPHRGSDGPRAIATMPDARDPDQDDEVALLRTIGELWCHGVEVDFASFHEGEPETPRLATVRRLLPTYRFERTSYWTRPEASAYVDHEGGADAVDDAAHTDATTQPAPPLVRFVERPAARLRLYCFPFAGGDTSAFRSFARSAPSWLDVVAVRPPGRTDPHSDDASAAKDDETVLAELGAAIRSDAGSCDVAFCGLSFGASLLLDLLVGPLADWAGQGRVKAVCVAGRNAIVPELGVPELEPDAYLMAPDELRRDEQWRRRVLPLLQADLAFDARAEARIQRWQRERGTEIVDCPLQVHCGSADASAPAGSAGAWAALTRSPIVDVVIHDGTHDFLIHQQESIFTRMLAFLERLDPRLAQGADSSARLTYEPRWVPVGALAQRPARDTVPWIDVDGTDPAACLRFLRGRLTHPEATAALLCRLSPLRTPSQHCADLFILLKAAVEEDLRGRLVFVLPARDNAGLVAGMTRSVAQEEPGLRLQRVYLPELPDVGDPPDWLDRILRDVVSDHPREVDLLYRDGMLLAQRLLPAALPDLPSGILGRRAGSYLLTGGTGGIGRMVTDWLIHDQDVDPSRVIVAGRKEPGDLRRGVRFCHLDLACPPTPEGFAEQTGPLAGIVHLAGALDDGILRNLDVSRFPAVLAPKLALAYLAEVGRRTAAPWIVAFSSTSSLLGAAGQANYAAANGWVDARAMWPPPTGAEPYVVSINWGSWGEVGMAARDQRALATARRNGEAPLRSGAALRAFGQVIAAILAGTSGGRNFAVCDVDWRQPVWSDLPLVSALSAPAPTVGSPADGRVDVPPGTGPSDGSAAPKGADPSTASGDEIRSFLSAYVHRWEPTKRLADLGLDSLDFARMRSDFARKFGRDVALAAIARPDQSLSDLYAFLSEQ